MRKMILVTGAHRSGTTWTGRIISSAKNIRNIHEPFNIGIERKNNLFTNWFEHLNHSSKQKEKQAKHYLKSFFLIFHMETFKRILRIRSLKEGYVFFADVKGRLLDRTLIKDPIAVMSAEWIYNNFNCDLIVTVRHPAAFIASLKEKDWQYDFNNFLNQENLMNTYLKNYKDAIVEYSSTQPDIIKQGILLWNTIYTTVLFYKRKYGKDWYFVKHEDLSNEPLIEFEKIFDFLHLTFDENVKSLIIETTSSRENSENKRNSRSNVKAWKNRLSFDEINLIKQETKHVWVNFYSENDWD